MDALVCSRETGAAGGFCSAPPSGGPPCCCGTHGNPLISAFICVESFEEQTLREVLLLLEPGLSF